jgi:hypothetical protein
MLVWSILTSPLHYLRTSLAVTIWIDEKNDLILLNLSSTWIKIWIAVHVTWDETKFNWIQIYLNSNQIKFLKNIEFTILILIQLQFNNWINIQLKKNELQIGGEGTENLLINLVLEFCFIKKQNISITDTFPCLFICKWDALWNCPSDNLQLIKCKVLPKSILMNHCQWT